MSNKIDGYFLNCYCAELYLESISVPKDVFEKCKERSFNVIVLQGEEYKIISVSEAEENILNLHINIFQDGN